MAEKDGKLGIPKEYVERCDLLFGCPPPEFQVDAVDGYPHIAKRVSDQFDFGISPNPVDSPYYLCIGKHFYIGQGGHFYADPAASTRFERIDEEDSIFVFSIANYEGRYPSYSFCQRARGKSKENGLFVNLNGMLLFDLSTGAVEYSMPFVSSHAVYGECATIYFRDGKMWTWACGPEGGNCLWHPTRKELIPSKTRRELLNDN